MADSEIQTWHYGLVARWWAEFNQDGAADIAFFGGVIERCGQPVLDAGCGTGRLLLPFVRSGLDVDGSDVSQDMLDWCARRAETEGLSVNLYHQAMHQLDLPRKYRTVVACGAFGLGGDRSTDIEGLRRIRAHLEPEGMLILDHHVAKTNLATDEGAVLARPLPWPEHGDRRPVDDRTVFELRTRLVESKTSPRSVVREISVRQFDDGIEVAHETNSIVICLYSASELQELLVEAGFRDVRVEDELDVHDSTPNADRLAVSAVR